MNKKSPLALRVLVSSAIPGAALTIITPSYSSAATFLQIPTVQPGGTAPVVAADLQPGTSGSVSTTADGSVITHDGAKAFGDLSGAHLDAPVSAIVTTPTGGGYWLIGSDGGVFTFGEARFYGSTGSIRLNQPVIGGAPTPDGKGYWLVAADGGVFAFGDAGFYGSTGATRLDAPVAGIAPTADGHGYWLLSSDGGVFTFGDAAFYGSASQSGMTPPAVSLAATNDGKGYRIASQSGQIYDFGDASYFGAPTASLQGDRVLGLYNTKNGYDVSTALGALDTFSPQGSNIEHVAAVSAASTGSTSTGPLADRGPSAAQVAACDTPAATVAACDAAALADINTARAAESLPALPLPDSFNAMSAQDQLATVANAERTSRGLPAFPGLTAGLNALAQQAANRNSDPVGPANTQYASNLASGTLTVLQADFEWMYDDGPGGTNGACMGAISSGCWLHRQNILSPWTGTMGAGVTVYGAQHRMNLTQLFVAG